MIFHFMTPQTKMKNENYSEGELVYYIRIEPAYSLGHGEEYGIITEKIPAIILKYRKLLKTVDLYLQKSIAYSNKNIVNTVYNIHISSIEKINN